MEVAYTSWNLQDLTGGPLHRSGWRRRSAPTSSAATASPGRDPPPACASTCSPCGRSGRRGRRASRCDFEGEFSSHTLMPPAFRPAPTAPWRAAGAGSAAVRERMIEVAGEVADGLLVHPLQSPRYLDAGRALPRSTRGLARAGRDASDVGGARWRSSSPPRPPSSRPSGAGWRSTARRRATGTCSRCTASTTSSASSTRCRAPGAGTGMPALVDDDALGDLRRLRRDPGRARGGPAPRARAASTASRCTVRGRGGPGVMVRHRPRAQELSVLGHRGVEVAALLGDPRRSTSAPAAARSRSPAWLAALRATLARRDVGRGGVEPRRRRRARRRTRSRAASTVTRPARTSLATRSGSRSAARPARRRRPSRTSAGRPGCTGTFSTLEGRLHSSPSARISSLLRARAVLAAVHAPRERLRAVVLEA